MTFCLSRNAMAMAYLHHSNGMQRKVGQRAVKTCLVAAKLLMAPTLQQLSSRQTCGQTPGQTLSAPAAGHSMAEGRLLIADAAAERQSKHLRCAQPQLGRSTLQVGVVCRAAKKRAAAIPRVPGEHYPACVLCGQVTPWLAELHMHKEITAHQAGHSCALEGVEGERVVLRHVAMPRRVLHGACN